MKHLSELIVALALASAAPAQDVKRNIPYAGVDDEKRTLDVYAPANAKNLPVVFWIHGGVPMAVSLCFSTTGHPNVRQGDGLS